MRGLALFDAFRKPLSAKDNQFLDALGELGRSTPVMISIRSDIVIRIGLRLCAQAMPRVRPKTGPLQG